MPDSSPTARLLEAIARREHVQSELDAAALDVSRRMLELRDSMPPKQIAELIGVSHQRIYQVLARAERELADMETSIRAEIEDRRAASYGLASAGRNANRGFESGSFPCFECGRRKSRPSSTCDHCGDSPVSHNGDPLEFDRSYGYA